MRIGELADRVGTSTRTLRYYESRGLLAARRTANGYRSYGEEDVRLVREIRALLGIGFALEDTRPFVECLRSGHDAGDACPASLAVYRRKLAEMDACLERLTAARARLAEQLALAEASVTPRCAFTAPEGPPGDGPSPECGHDETDHDDEGLTT